MKALLLAAALAAITASTAHAYAAEIALGTPGQWVDNRHRTIVSPDDGRLVYAKLDCHAKTGDGVGGRYAACLKSQGFGFVVDSPAQIAAREKDRQDQRNRETLYAFGQALSGVAEAMQPHGCNGQIQPSGSFSTRCY